MIYWSFIISVEPRWIWDTVKDIHSTDDLQCFKIQNSQNSLDIDTCKKSLKNIEETEKKAVVDDYEDDDAKQESLDPFANVALEHLQNSKISTKLRQFELFAFEEKKEDQSVQQKLTKTFITNSLNYILSLNDLRISRYIYCHPSLFYWNVPNYWFCLKIR